MSYHVRVDLNEEGKKGNEKALAHNRGGDHHNNGSDQVNAAEHTIVIWEKEPSNLRWN